MTTKHTPGLMHQGLVRKGYVLPSGEGRVEAILVPGKWVPEAEAEANASYAVASWNALDGLTDEEAQPMAPGSVKLLLEACRAFAAERADAVLCSSRLQYALRLTETALDAVEGRTP